MSKVRRMFPGGNTSQGFISFHDNIIGEDRRKIYILKGMPGGGKSYLMNNIGGEDVRTRIFNRIPSLPFRSYIHRWNSNRRT